MAESSIEWTDKTWNPTRGCSLASPGCTNCYAMRQAHRFSAPGGAYAGLTRLTNHGPMWTGRLETPDGMLTIPLRWRKPCRVFVNSMSDLFHEALSNEEIAAVFGIMAACPQHTFQVLTKRAKRMREWFEWVAAETEVPHSPDAAFLVKTMATNCGAEVDQLAPSPWPLPNVWLGVSVENQRYADERIPELLATPAAVRFLSCEPLLGPLNLSWGPNERHGCGGETANPDCVECDQSLRTIDWVIVGGESGNGAREFQTEWARSIVAQCRDAGTAVFVKQLGAKPLTHVPPGGAPDDGGDLVPLRLRSRKGGDMAEWPVDLRVREFPRTDNDNGDLAIRNGGDGTDAYHG